MSNSFERASRWIDATTRARVAGALAMAAIAVGLATPATANAQAALVRGLGGPADFGTNELMYNDDGSSSEIDVSRAFPYGLRFFGMTFRSLFVNNNGNITFGRGLSTYTPRAFPVSSQRMIAPWWGDVDTRGEGRPDRNGVYWDIRPGQFTVTWYRVGYFLESDDLQNSFQLIIRPAPVCGNGDFDVEFRYNQCQWHTGDASGGERGVCPAVPVPSDPCVPTQAGFDGGDLRNFFALPGSLTPAILNLCTTSNVGMPGVWRFQIRGGELPCLGSGDRCSTGLYGACAQGTVQCRSGRPFCAPDNQPRVERCDGVDNDCDGRTDENDRMAPPDMPPIDPDAGMWTPDSGVSSPDAAASDGSVDSGVDTGVDSGVSTDTGVAPDGGVAPDSGVTIPPVCPRNGDVCFRGTCVPGCVEGACFGDQTCTSESVCVETSCLRVDCPTGQLCRSGRCVDPCEGVRCPAPTTCRFGVCQDLCLGVTCDPLHVCREGRCVPGCQCVPCATGETCLPSGQCIPTLCTDAMCDPGDVCDSRGRCINPCTDARCPLGQTCDRAMRRCVDETPSMPDPPPDSGVNPVEPDSAAPPPDGGTTMDSGVGDNEGGTGPGLRRQGCACRAPAAPSDAGSRPLLLLAAAGAIAAVTRRRRR
ncbi:MAG: hypothetical protein JNK05_21280 [Myxococcales bacterium]|nr:hypothetical protein [Myxococcales bacterium]